jgi:hypothetical protein
MLWARNQTGKGIAKRTTNKMNKNKALNPKFNRKWTEDDGQDE